MTDLVIYYSRTNNTRLVAESIKNEKNAEIMEIRDKKSRSGPVGYMIGAFDALREKRTQIEYDAKDLKSYDTVYIGSPVWASKPAPAIMEFIRENDFGGVNAVPFCTMGSSGAETTLNYMNHLIISGGGKISDSFSIAVKNNDVEEATRKILNDEM
jgi:flavodoxin